MQNFKTLPQLFDYFKDERTCLDYLEQQRWAGNVTCPFCGSEKPYNTDRGYKCRNKDCHKKFTAKVGTIYENSKISLRTWFGAIYLCTAHKKGISSCQLARDLGITQKTAWFVLHRIREMLKEKAPKMVRTEVQVDETYVGGKETNKHASKKGKKRQGRCEDGKTPVFGIYEKEGTVMVKVLPLVSRKQVQKIISERIEKESTMVSDAFIIYGYLAKENEYKHVVVNHKNGEYVKDGYHTNGIENFWSQLKRGIIGIYHQVSPEHLQRYCDEFAARYNTRKIKDHERFQQVIQGSEGRLKYNQLIGKI